MRTVFLSFACVLLLVFSASAQTVDEKVDTYIKANSKRKSGEYLTSRAATSSCNLSDRKDMAVYFTRKAPPSPQDDSLFDLLASGMAFYIYQNVLCHYPAYDCLTVSVLNQTTNTTQSTSFYFLGGQIWTSKNGVAKRIN